MSPIPSHRFVPRTPNGMDTPGSESLLCCLTQMGNSFCTHPHAEPKYPSQPIFSPAKVKPRLRACCRIFCLLLKTAFLLKEREGDERSSKSLMLTSSQSDARLQKIISFVSPDEIPPFCISNPYRNLDPCVCVCVSVMCKFAPLPVSIPLSPF